MPVTKQNGKVAFFSLGQGRGWGTLRGMGNHLDLAL